MIGLCDLCAYKNADCKGNKDLEKVHCPYYKKPEVFNAKSAAERIAELEEEVEEWKSAAERYRAGLKRIIELAEKLYEDPAGFETDNTA